MAAVAVSLALLPGAAQAQVFKVCGDVDDNDVVTVTDGVQVLRAAAGLSSDCTAAICDVDVNGTIGVTDGVITLRKAAGLSITENCIPDEGTINRQVAHLVQRTQPLVSEAMGTLVLHRNEVSDATFNCENGEDGTLDLTFDGQLTASFSDCQIEHVLINGDVENANRSPVLALEIADAGTEESISFDGGLLGVTTETGVKFSGNLDAVPTFDSFDTGDFLLVMNSLEVAPTGFPLAGSVTLVLNEDSAVPGVTRVRIIYDGSNLARVVVTFDDASVGNYTFELNFRNFI